MCMGVYNIKYLLEIKGELSFLLYHVDPRVWKQRTKLGHQELLPAEPSHQPLFYFYLGHSNQRHNFERVSVLVCLFVGILWKRIHLNEKVELQCDCWLYLDFPLSFFGIGHFQFIVVCFHFSLMNSYLILATQAMS